MPCPHFDVKVIQRSKRQSAVASAAYQSGKRLFSEYDQKQKYYSYQSEIVHTEIVLLPHAHIFLTMRAMDKTGKWFPKSRKVYDLDENGERIRLASGRWKSYKEDTVDWNDWVKRISSQLWYARSQLSFRRERSPYFPEASCETVSTYIGQSL